jgi:mono/diheme cytochrome c family protein
MTNLHRPWYSGLLVTSAALTSLFVMPIVSAGPAEEGSVSGRWYAPSQVETGLGVYQANCAGCHGAGGEGAPNWEQRDFLGHYPPPPLDGGGHSAHHPLKQLLRTVTLGGAAMGGTMPAFGDVLDEGQIHAAIAYIQSLWSDEIYSGWVAQNFETVSH